MLVFTPSKPYHDHDLRWERYFRSLKVPLLATLNHENPIVYRPCQNPRHDTDHGLDYALVWCKSGDLCTKLVTDRIIRDACRFRIARLYQKMAQSLG